MAIYQLRITNPNGTQTLSLSSNQTIEIQASENTKFEILNENGELVSDFHTAQVNQSDLAVHLGQAEQPSVIVKSYYNYYPIENSTYLKEISASFASGSQEAPFVLASEVASGVSSAALSSFTVYGAAALAAGVAGVSLAKRGGSSNAQAESKQSVESVPPKLFINPIASDDVINAVEKQQESLIVSGYVINSEHAEAKAGDQVELKVGELTLLATLNAELAFSVPMSTLALVNHKIVNAKLVIQDKNAKSVSAEADKSVTVDETFTVDVSVADITLDNTINKTEAAGRLTLSGSYTTDSDVKAGSVKISLTINGEEKAAEVNETSKTWQLTVDGTALAQNQGENHFTVNIAAEDVAGNTKSISKTHTYQVDTVLAKPVVTITSIAEDDVIDATEANGSIKITGIVENYEGSNSVVLLCPCQSCASGWKEVEAQVVDGKFEVDVLVSETSLANAKLKSSERVVKAKYTAKDTAGNEAAADEASRKYELDTHREINITKIGEQFTQSLEGSTRITGTITEFSTANGAFANAYNEGQNARLIRKVTLVIGDKRYQAGFNGVTKTFSADIPNADLIGLSGKNVSIDFSDMITNHPTPYSFYAFTTANMLRTNATGKLEVYTARSLTPTAKSFTLDGDVLVKNSENSYSVKTFATDKTEISGVVNENVAVGAEIEVKVGNYTTTTVVQEGRTFSVEVDSSYLKNSPANVVTATLKNTDADVVTDKEFYIAPKAVSGNFVSQHSEVPPAARKLDHTKDDYNFFYPIHLLETETTKRGALKNYALGGTETPLKVKYHFLRNDEVASLPTSSQGVRARESAAGSVKEATDTMKQMFRYAYKKIAEYTNIKFEEVNSWQEANGNNSDMGTGTDGTLIFVGNLNGGQYNGASAIGFQGGNIIWNEAVSSATPAYNDFNAYTAMHEILHTLNLRHAHDAFSGVRTLGAAVPAATNQNHIAEATAEFSNMSYWGTTGMFVGMRDLRLYDLAYLHYRFGVNREHRAGNDTYTFKTYDARKADGDVYIWDGNGVDTFDASMEKEGVTVNLTPGSWNYRGTERKFNFLADDRTVYNKQAYFNLDPATEVNGNLVNSHRVRFNEIPAGHAEFINYHEGQSFIGYGTQIENLIGSKFADKLTGNNADNNIFGGAGDDTIIGGLGDDFINGGEGNDLMFGNAGSDTYVIDSVGDVVTEEAGEGDADHVYSFIDHTLENNVENLTLVGTTAKEGIGNAQNNIIRGNDIGNTLNGMDGDDTLIGGLGKDTLTGGEGKDTFVFESALNGKADTITDFVRGTDQIKLSKVIFAAIQDDLGNLSQHLFYDATSGELSYSQTGSADTAVHFATVSGLGTLDNTVFVLV